MVSNLVKSMVTLKVSDDVSDGGSERNEGFAGCTGEEREGSVDEMRGVGEVDQPAEEN